MANAAVLDAQNVASFLAKQLHGTGPTEHELAESISEVELQTQTKGSSFIKIQIADPEWRITCSGLIDRNEEGMLPPLEVEFPQNSNMYWTLCAAEPSNELSQPNLVLTFEDRIVRTLKEHWGEKRAAPGKNTRAEFIKALCIEAGVKYRIPSVEGAQEKLNKQQTIQAEIQRQIEGTKAIESRIAGAVKLTPEGQTAAEAKANKEPGLGVGSNITVKHVQATAGQITLLNTALGAANEIQAPVKAQVALVCALIQENTCSNPDPGNSGDRGCLSLIDSTIHGIQNHSGTGYLNPYDVKEVVQHFLAAGFTGKGGAIELSKSTHPAYTAGEIAQLCQGSAFPTAYSQWETEAAAIVGLHGGSTATGANTEANSKAGEVARGTTGNPSEDSWDCMVRLAGAVNYSVFTNGQTLFYMSGTELVEQKPTAWVHPKPDVNHIVREYRGRKITETGVIQVPLNATFDNTTVEYFATRKIKGRVQKRSRIGRPQSPSEIKMNVVCEALDYAAGEVFLYEDAGPLNGRWIITDATRNCFKDKYTQLLLEPPQAPLAESEEGKPLTTPTSPGVLAAVAEEALKALAEKSKYSYTEASPARENNGTLFGSAPRTMDCSAFATLCYKAAGMPDPSGQNYHPIGWTGSMIVNMVKTSKPVPGDLCFYGPSVTATKHVTVYVGNGEVVSMGGPGDPSRGPAASMGPAGFLGYWKVG